MSWWDGFLSTFSSPEPAPRTPDRFTAMGRGPGSLAATGRDFNVAASVLDKVWPDADTTAGQAIKSAEETYTTALDYTNRGISAASLFTNPTSPSTFGNAQQSWEAGDNISAGQAASSNPLSIINPVNMFDPLTQRQAFNLATGRPTVDVTDERVRKAVFESDGAEKWFSGGTDAAIMWFTDPLVVGGKAYKAARTMTMLQPIRSAADNRRFVQGIVDAQAFNDSRGTISKWTPEGQLVMDLTQGTVAQNAMHPFIKRSTNRGALAHLTGESQDFNETALIIRAAANDQNAISYLWETRASVADALEMWKGMAGADGRALKETAGSLFNAETGAFKSGLRERAQQTMESGAFRAKAVEKADKKSKGAVSRSERIEDALIQRSVTAEEAAAEFVRLGTSLASADAVRSVQKIRGALLSGRVTEQEARSQILSVMHSAREAKITRAEDSLKMKAIRDDLKATDEYLRRFEDDLLRNGMSVGSEITASRSVTIEKMRASRARRKADSFYGTVPKEGEEIKQTVFQRNPFVRAVRYFTWHPLRERQSGYVYFAGANMIDSDKEIMAAIDQTPALTKMAKSADPNVRAEAAKIKNELINKWYAAAYDVDRRNAVAYIEKRLFEVTAKSHNLPEETTIEMMAKYSSKRRSTIDEMVQNGYAIDPVDKSIIEAPQLISQLAESTPIMDFRYMDKLIRENKTVLSMPRKSFNWTRDVTARTLDEFYAIWRPAVLLRLGYTQRNVLEGNLRAVAAYGFIPSLLDPAGSLRRMGSNYANDAKWAGSRIGAWASPSSRSLKAQIESETTAVLSQRQLAAEKAKSLDEALSGFVGKDDHLYDFLSNKMSRAKFIKAERSAAQAALADPAARVSKGLGSGVITVGEASSELLAHAFRVGNVNLAESVKRVRDGLSNGVITDAEAVQQLRVLASQSAVEVTPRIKRAMRLEQQFKRGEITQSQLGKALEKNALRPVPGDVRDLARELRQTELGLRKSQTTLDSLIGVQSGKRPIRKQHVRYGQGPGEAFDGPMGAAAASNASSSKTNQRMISDPLSEAVRRRSEKVTRQTRIEPVEYVGGKPQVKRKYFKYLLDITERQVKNDPVARMLLEGRTDKQIMKWIDSKDAHMWRRQMARTGIDVRNPEQHIANLRGIIEYYYPSKEIRRAVLDRKMSADELKKLYGTTDMYQLPILHGSIAERGEIKPSLDGIMSLYEGVTGGMYRVLGTLPEDILLRHRFYAKVWQDERDRLTMLDKAMRSDALTDAQKAARRLEIERSAHRTALRATRETLYTIERESNLTAKLRWVSPFFAAQENTLRVWLGIARRDPSIIARAQMIYDAPNRLGLVVDADGNEIPAASLPYSSIFTDAYMSLNPNDEISEFAFGGARGAFSKQSLNVVLQGSMPVAPGMGPPVQIAATMFFRDNPEKLSDMKGTAIGNTLANILLPFGNVSTDEAWQQVLPAWVDKVLLYARETNSKEYSNFMMMQAVALRVDMENGVIPPDQYPKTDQEFERMVRDRTKSAYLWRALANLTLPFGVKMDSKYQFYVDELRKIQEESPDFRTAFAKFTDKYPRFAYVAANLSKNPSGMNATRPALDRFNANESLVKDLALQDPSLVALVTNPIGMEGAEFDQAVYAWSYDRQILENDPDADKRLRTIQAATEGLNAVDIQLGWKEYSALKLWWEPQMQELGYKSVKSLPDDFKKIWSDAVAEIAAKYPDWELARGENNPVQVRNRFKVIEGLTQNASFMSQQTGDEMWGMVAQYMADRNVVLGMIAEAKANGDDDVVRAYKDAWFEIENEYVESNTKFSAFYDRWLDYDPEIGD